MEFGSKKIRDCYDVAEYDNKMLVIKYQDDTIESAKKDELCTFSNVLDEVDTYIIGDEFCLSNYAMGCLLYNYYSDLCYIFNLDYLDTLKNGEAVTLLGHTPDNDEREEINSYFGD